MPAPAQTSLPAIVTAARRLVEDGGLAALTMADVARVVGVRAPSLYKRVDDRAQLVRLVVEDVASDLGRQLAAVGRTGDPRADLRALANTFRTFAHRHPVVHGLLFGPLPDGSTPDPALLAEASLPMLDVTAALAGDDGLSAARTAVAWAHGFVSMELAGAFRLGGDVEEAWRWGLDHLVSALAPDAPAGPRR